MSIARDSNSSIGISSASSLTWSHTCSGSNRILFVWGYVEGSNTLTGCTYNAVSMTQITFVTTSGRSLYAYFLVAPATGANNIVLTNSGTSGMTGLAISYTGARQTGQPDSSGSANQGVGITAQSINITTVAANSWIAGGMVNDGGIGSAVGNGAYTKLATGGWNGTMVLDSNGPIVTPALTACGWTGANSSTANAQTISVSIAPVGAASNSAFFAFM